MRLLFWGTRGSLPASVDSETIRRKIFKVVKLASGLSFHSDEEIEKFLFNNLSDKNLSFSATGSYGTNTCLLYTYPSPRDRTRSRMPSYA